MSEIKREAGCTCNFGTNDNPVFGGYARCAIHDPNMKTQNFQELFSGITRRSRLDLSEPAELAIYNAMVEVEKVGGDVRLTKAVTLLSEAKDLVADFIDEKLNASIKTLGSNR